MLVFVIPLKSPQVSKSWERVCQLVERTARSVCQQTSPQFRVVIVCNEKPKIKFAHPHLSYLEVDFPTPKEENPIAKGLTDKGRKVLAGLIYARQFEPTHAMSVDADDCVSRRLAEFVSKNPAANGWFINKGYKYQENSRFIYYKWQNFYRMSGTANIIRYDLLELPQTPEYNRGYGYYKFYVDHQKVNNYMLEKGKAIARLPFAGGIYILGDQNMSGNERYLSFSLFNRKWLTRSLREEFGLYSITQEDTTASESLLSALE
jgi:hypothetical protein